MSARLLIIGLEATDLSLVQRHAGEGRLAAIAELTAHGRLKTFPAGVRATDAALWASFQYAAEVGEHGRYYDMVRLRSGYFGFAVQEEQERKAIWDELSCHGMRVAVFDIPKSRAPKAINGIHLVDWLVHGRLFPRPLSYPAALAGDVVGRFGEAPPSRCGQTGDELADDQILESIEHLRTSVSMKRTAALFYLAQEPWDCFLVNFKEMHCCSHGFWNLIDPRHPTHDRARALRLGDPSAAILHAIDTAIGELMAAAGADSEVIVFSTSGMEANGSAYHLLPKIVTQLNKYIGNHGAGLLPPRSNWVVKMLPYAENACALHVSRSSRVRVRVRVRGPAPDGNNAAMIGVLEDVLLRMSDPATGEAIFEACHRPSSDYVGTRSRSLPDMLLVPRAGVFPQSAVSAELGYIASRVPRWRPGNHRDGGFLIARGAGVGDAVDAIDSLAHLGCVARNILLPCAGAAAVARPQFE